MGVPDSNGSAGMRVGQPGFWLGRMMAVQMDGRSELRRAMRIA